MGREAVRGGMDIIIITILTAAVMAINILTVEAARTLGISTFLRSNSFLVFFNVFFLNLVADFLHFFAFFS